MSEESMQRMEALIPKLAHIEVQRARRQAVATSGKVVEAPPKDPRWLNDLALNYDRLGDMFHTIGNRSQARDAFKAGMETHQELAALEPNNTQWQRDYARNRTDSGLFEFSRGKDGGALGMQTLDQCLTDLVRRNVISIAEARNAAAVKENFPG